MTNNIPDAAIEAAANTLGQIVPNHDGVLWEYDDPEDGQRQAITVTEAAKRSIHAAMPAIREAIAQEIEATELPTMLPTRAPRAYGMALSNAARIVRGGAA